MSLSRPNRVSYKLWSSLIVLLLGLQFALSACGNEDAPATTGPNSTTSAPTTSTSTIATSPTVGGNAAGVPNTPTTGSGTTTSGSVTAASNLTGAVPTALATATPVSGLKAQDQVLTITSGEIQTLDPALANDVGTSFVLRQFYSGLLSLNKNLEVVPDLAASMPQVSENGTLYTFKLRPGAKFHTGREVTADDVKFSLERNADPALANGAVEGLPAANYLSDIVGIKDRLEGKSQTISGITVKDKYTLTIKTDAPKPYFLAKMTYNCFFILNKDSISKGFDAPDGTGPFTVKEYRKKQQLTLVKNPNFYNGVPALNQVNILLGAGAANELVLYEQGKVDIASADGSIERALDKNSLLNSQLVVKPQLDLQYIAYNTKAKPFDDPKVRQAFSLVVDRAKIARVMFEGKVVKADTILPPGLPGFTGNAGNINYDVNRARDLIAQSSYKSAANLPKITLYTTGSRVASVLQSVYKDAFNIDLEVRQYDFGDFQTGLSQKAYQMYTFGWVADYPDPENFLRALLGTGSAFNDCNYSNKDFDEMMKQADQQTDPAKRLAMYGQAEQLALNDAPLLPIYHSVSYVLVKPYIKGVDVTGSGIISLKDVYIQK